MFPNRNMLALASQQCKLLHKSLKQNIKECTFIAIPSLREAELNMSSYQLIPPKSQNTEIIIYEAIQATSNLI